jgi:hypothetical protein
MIHKLLIVDDGKLIYENFSVIINNNKIYIECLRKIDSYIKVPIFNNNSGLLYYPIIFPLEFIIINNYYFNPYIILSYDTNISDNKIDFFYNIYNIIDNMSKFRLLTFQNMNLMKILSDNYISNINMENYNNIDNVQDVIKILWTNINIIKLGIIYLLIKHPNISNKNYKDINSMNTIPKKLYTYANILKSFKYDLLFDKNHSMNFIDYYNYDFTNPIKLNDIKPNTTYFIENNKTKKIIKISIKKINKNIIMIDDIKSINYENYNWYIHYPSIKINKNYIIFHTFINSNITNQIIKTILNIEDIHSNKIVEYYEHDNKLSNIISLFNNIKIKLNAFDILRYNSYTDAFFIYITENHSNNNDIYDILGILFNNYNYPLKSNRMDLENNFDYIMYFSLYNYKSIFIETKSNNDLLHPNINNTIPNKLKILYINILKMCIQLINNEFDIITYNHKFYSDILHRNILKIIFTDSNKLFINLLKTLINKQTYEKFKNIVYTNILLIDISNKLSWSTLPRKLDYLNCFYKNSDILFYHDKLNKNIITDNFDSRLKKIIENPFEMYKFLRKEKDFIKWTKFIFDKIIMLYYVPISLSSNDYNHIGKMIYLLFNITDQNLKDETYMNFINHCNLYTNLILDNTRINLKIKENFSTLKVNINLGFLAKHMIINKETITLPRLTYNEKSDEVKELEIKLENMTKKYYKYKLKYLETKDIDAESIIVKYKLNNNISDTSNIIPDTS